MQKVNMANYKTELKQRMEVVLNEIKKEKELLNIMVKYPEDYINEFNVGKRIHRLYCEADRLVDRILNLE